MLDEKLSVRLSPALYTDVQQAARRRHTTPSAFIRLALQQALDQSTPASAPSAPPPGDTWEWLVMILPPEVQTRARQTVDCTGMSVGAVMRALLVSAAGVADTPPRPS